jgi:hypothetical protein
MKFWNFDVLGDDGTEYNLPFAKRNGVPQNGISTDEYDFYPETYIILSDIHLYEGSSEVDFFSGVIELEGWGFFISEQALKILKKFNLPPYEILDVNVFLPNGDKTSKKYYWLHLIIVDKGELIDFDKSAIFKVEDNKRNKIKSNNDLMEINDAFDIDVDIECKKVILGETLLKDNIDMFYLEGLELSEIINDRLKSAFINAQLTGLRPFEQFEIISV